MPKVKKIAKKIKTVKNKVSPKKQPVESKLPKPAAEHYFEASGRRKTSAARVRLLTKGNIEILVNDKSYTVHFPTLELQEIILSPLKMMNCSDKFRILIRVRGGGIHSQAEAIRHGITRTLVLFNSEFRKRLKKAGFLTRDSRMRERKKFGLKRARRAPQWRKR